MRRGFYTGTTIYSSASSQKFSLKVLFVKVFWLNPVQWARETSLMLTLTEVISDIEPRNPAEFSTRKEHGGAQSTSYAYASSLWVLRKHDDHESVFIMLRRLLGKWRVHLTIFSKCLCHRPRLIYSWVFFQIKIFVRPQIMWIGFLWKKIEKYF